MVRARPLIAWLAVVLIATGGAAAPASDGMAEIVPRADDVGSRLSIEIIDGKPKGWVDQELPENSRDDDRKWRRSSTSPCGW